MLRRDTTLHKPGHVTKNWKIVDANGISLGRLAAEVATCLMGKNRPDWTPHVDCGDFVIVTNASKVQMTGNKGEQKTYQTYSEYPGGLRKQTYNQLRDKKPELLIQQAVRRMLPKNRMARIMLKNMKVFPGAEHTFADRKPVELKV